MKATSQNASPSEVVAGGFDLTSDVGEDAPETHIRPASVITLSCVSLQPASLHPSPEKNSLTIGQSSAAGTRSPAPDPSPLHRMSRITSSRAERKMNLKKFLYIFTKMSKNKSLFSFRTHTVLMSLHREARRSGSEWRDTRSHPHRTFSIQDTGVHVLLETTRHFLTLKGEYWRMCIKR